MLLPRIMTSNGGNLSPALMIYGIAVENLTVDVKDPVVLDIGAGTGLFTGMVLQKYP